MSTEDPRPQRPKRGQRRFVELPPGHTECYECGGDGACRVCDGAGRLDNQLCDNCQGTGRCVVCRGVGYIVADTSAQPGWLTYEQGHEHAPDSRWGLQILRLSRTGEYSYERRQAGQLLGTRSGRIDASVAALIFESLADGGFPTVPAHSFPPGATVLTISIEGTPSQKVELDRRVGLGLPGYREAIRALMDAVDTIRKASEREAPP